MNDERRFEEDREGRQQPEAAPGTEMSADEPMTDEQTVEIARQELTALREMAEQADKMRDAALRARADFSNYQRRMDRERVQIRDFALRDALGEMLPFIEKFRLSMEKANEHPDFDALMEAMQIVQRELQAYMQRVGLERIEAVGQKFDPAVHEAITHLPSPDAEPGTVIDETRAGYKVGEQVIQPAQVVVARKPE